MQRIQIFDTTLGIGERAPGAGMTAGEKLRMAEQLDALGVDVIEVGVPTSSPADFVSIQRIARQVRRPVIAALARALPQDIDRAAEALAGADRPRIHTFLATSDHRLQERLRIDRTECLERVHTAVSRAKRQVGEVQFTAEDATRSDLAFLTQVLETAIDAGATTLNLADSAGYAAPKDFTSLLQTLFDSVRGIEGVTLSVHAQNDLGLALANSVTAIESGARQVVCTVNGIGDRAGNTALEEIAMLLKVRPDLGGFETAIRTDRIHPVSQLLTHITGLRPHPSKAIVGENAIMQAPGESGPVGSVRRRTDPILTPEMVGAPRNRIEMGRHTGRQAFLDRLRELGYELDPDREDMAYDSFRALAEAKKQVLDEDLLAIYYHGTLEEAAPAFRLEHLHVVCGQRPARATVGVSELGEPAREATAEGDGPIDAAFAALQAVIPWETRLEGLTIQAASPGTDAVGEVHLQLRVSGHVFTGRAAATDVVDAAARAFLNAVDKAAHTRQLEARSLEQVAYWGV